jgi:hypothetical protein
MFEGRIVGMENAADADIGRIGLMMTGGTHEDEAAREGGRADPASGGQA